MKINEQYVTTMEELLNQKTPTPYIDFVDLYVIIDNYTNHKIAGYAIRNGDQWKLLDSMKECLSYAKNQNLSIPQQ